MQPSFLRFMIHRWMLAGAIFAVSAPELLACSGPGAMTTIRNSQLIGLTLGGTSLAIVAVASIFLHLRLAGRGIPWIVAPLVLHPAWWMSAVRGDCGYGLRTWSFVATTWIAIAVALAILWSDLVKARRKKRRWLLGGALGSALAGVPIAALIVDGAIPVSAVSSWQAGAAFFSSVIVGTIVGAGIFPFRIHTKH
jgi:hypothetical protein